MKHLRIRHLPLCLCSLMAMAQPMISHSADMLTLGSAGEKGYRSSLDPVEIHFGQAMPADLAPYLRLEINAIDVTDFVQRSDQGLLYVPQEPLAPGFQELRLVAMLPDGTIEEAAIWTIEVRASKTFRVAETQGQIDLQVTHRVADDIDNSPSRRTQGQGGGTFFSQHADGDWSTTSRANLVYNSQSSQNHSGKELELTDYQIKGEWQRATLTMGHQNISPNSLVLNGFNRRGLSAGYTSEQHNFQTTAFSTRTEQITGFNHFTGINQSNHRTSGAMVSVNPFTSNPDQLTLSGIYLQGKGQSEGVAEISDATDKTGGDAQALIADSYLFNRLWRMRGEYASTSFDFDGKGTGLSSETDDAYTLLLDYDSSRANNNPGGDSGNWGLSLQHQHAGPWFYSLGNTAVTADRETTQLQGKYWNSTFSIIGLVSTGEDNVDDDDSLPTTAIDSASINLMYTPPMASVDSGSEPPAEWVFSNPSYSLNWSHYRLEQIDTPTGFTGDDVDSRYHEVLLSAAFSGNGWYWNLSQSFIDQDDRVLDANDQETLRTSLDSQFTINEYLSISPILQRTETDYVNQDMEIRSWLAGASIDLNYPSDWSYSLSHTVNREEASDDSIDSRAALTQATVQWRYREAAQNRFGITFFSNGSYQTTEDQGSDADDYQLFLGINVSLPISM